jgi:8-oxo-dGTP pyrophosphatase MutT (NUDIX family)
LEFPFNVYRKEGIRNNSRIIVYSKGLRIKALSDLINTKQAEKQTGQIFTLEKVRRIPCTLDQELRNGNCFQKFVKHKTIETCLRHYERLVLKHKKRRLQFMILRNCAGGIVFFGDKVFLLKNEKDEWVFPKGVMRNGDHAAEVAQKRVLEEGGIIAYILSIAGDTSYEFYSVTRQKPICNKITWFIMSTDSDKYNISEKEKFQEGGFFDIEEAMNLITYSQDKALLNLSYKKYKELP